MMTGLAWYSHRNACVHHYRSLVYRTATISLHHPLDCIRFVCLMAKQYLLLPLFVLCYLTLISLNVSVLGCSGIPDGVQASANCQDK
jgi:hypothetical protein